MRYFDNSLDFKPIAFPSALPADDSTAIMYTPSPVDAFLTEEVYDSSDSSAPPAIHIACDVTILFNQQRISKEISPLIAEWFSAHQGDVSDRFSNLSDADIMSCIKSKYLQRPSELKDWTSYLMSALDDLSAEKAAAEKAAAEKAAAEKAVVTSETSTE